MNLSCPKCESSMTTASRGCLFYILVLMFLPISLLLFLRRPVRQCKACGFTWKA